MHLEQIDKLIRNTKTKTLPIRMIMITNYPRASLSAGGVKNPTLYLYLLVYMYLVVCQFDRLFFLLNIVPYSSTLFEGFIHRRLRIEGCYFNVVNSTWFSTRRVIDVLYTLVHSPFFQSPRFWYH